MNFVHTSPLSVLKSSNEQHFQSKKKKDEKEIIVRKEEKNTKLSASSLTYFPPSQPLQA
jgi:hypothetical protein